MNQHRGQRGFVAKLDCKYLGIERRQKRHTMSSALVNECVEPLTELKGDPVINAIDVVAEAEANAAD